MIFGSVCSGIEAASVAWSPLDWRCAFVSEIAKFPCAALAHHYPDVPNYGDLNGFKDWPATDLDVLIGGTPCQSFSVAGLRQGLADPRGNLALTYLAVVDKYRPSWVVWENVPGVLSSGEGRDFAAFLGALGQLGYGWSYRVLDAQHFGVPQRRRRVFVVGSSRGWRAAAAVLFELESLRGDFAPSRQAREDVAGTLSARTEGGGGLGTDFELGGGLQVAHALRADGFDASEDGTGRGTPLVPVLSNAVCARDGKGPNSGVDQGTPLLVIPFDETQITNPENRGQPKVGAPSHTLASGARPPAIAFNARQDPDSGAATHPLDTDGYSVGVGVGGAVRRLTPRECERLQGFPDDYTAVPYRGKPAADGVRYHALGNSMAVPVVRWIGERIQMVEQLIATLKS